MAKYTCELSTIKKEGETNGRKWSIRKLNLKDEQGINLEVDSFDVVMSGEITEGEIITTERGSNFKKAQSPKAIAGANFKDAKIKETMEIKNQNISKFQDNKEFSIMTASSMSLAVNLAIAELSDNPRRAEGLEITIKKWRNWVINNWSINKTDTPAF